MAWRTFWISLLTFAGWMPANIFCFELESAGSHDPRTGRDRSHS
jgi:hypothetical protein